MNDQTLNTGDSVVLGGTGFAVLLEQQKPASHSRGFCRNGISAVCRDGACRAGAQEDDLPFQ